jgi:hypothetical protein
MALAANQTVNHVGMGRIQTVNATNSAVLTGFHTSQLDLNMVYKVSNKSRVFSTIIL